jgi:hypothetical protein
MYNLIIHQQLWGYKVEENLYLGVREQKRLNTTALDHIHAGDDDQNDDEPALVYRKFRIGSTENDGVYCINKLVLFASSRFSFCLEQG